MPEALPAPVLPNATPTALAQPEYCRGDGAVQTWLLLPLEPLQSELMAAYQAGQIIELQATVIGSSDDPDNLPHRSFMLSEAAEGITVTLDYQGDPPPLMLGQSYRLLAWADIQPMVVPSGVEIAEDLIPSSRTYALQVFDGAGLLFLGATDANLQGDPLGIDMQNAAGDCPGIPVVDNACVIERQVEPLQLRWQDQEVTLYPGEDRQMSQGDALYQVSLYRNRLTRYAEPSCPGVFEHARSLRIERLQPPPLPPVFLEDGQTLTATLPISGVQPLTATLPITAPGP